MGRLFWGSMGHPPCSGEQAYGMGGYGWPMRKEAGGFVLGFVVFEVGVKVGHDAGAGVVRSLTPRLCSMPRVNSTRAPQKPFPL